MTQQETVPSSGSGRKKAVVFSGGGARGAFEIGVWKALNELHYEPDIVAGTSVGALNGALYLQGDYDKAERLWKQIEADDVLDYEFPLKVDNFRTYQKTLFRFLFDALKSKGISATPLFEMIDKYVSDEETIRNKGIEFGLTVTDYETGEVVAFYLQDIPPGELPLYLIASASLYPAMEKIYIGDTPYIDGGYKNNLPIDLALEKQADEIVLVNILEFARVKPAPELKHKKVHVIKTNWELGDILYFHEKRTETNISLGYLETMKVFGRYAGNWYTIHSRSLKKEARMFDRFMKELVEGTHFPELSPLLTDRKQQFIWLNALRSAWGKRIRSEELFLVLAEVVGKVFWVPPTEVYEMDGLKEKIRQKAAYFEKEDFTQAMDQIVPEDFPMSGTEWMNHYKEKVPFISDKRMAAHFSIILEEEPSRCLSLPNRILIQLRPLPFLLSLYLWYLKISSKDFLNMVH